MGCIQGILKEMEMKYGADFSLHYSIHSSGREQGPVIISVTETQAGSQSLVRINDTAGIQQHLLQ